LLYIFSINSNLIARFIKKHKGFKLQELENIEIDLGNFNVLSEQIASGKSNFIQLLRFLRDISKEGVLNAVSQQGGVYYLTNIKIGKIELINTTLYFERFSNMFAELKSRLTLCI
jgi:predicted ATPase